MFCRRRAWFQWKTKSLSQDTSSKASSSLCFSVGAPAFSASSASTGLASPGSSWHGCCVDYASCMLCKLNSSKFKATSTAPLFPSSFRSLPGRTKPNFRRYPKHLSLSPYSFQNKINHSIFVARLFSLFGLNKNGFLHDENPWDHILSWVRAHCKFHLLRFCSRSHIFNIFTGRDLLKALPQLVMTMKRHLHFVNYMWLRGFQHRPHLLNIWRTACEKKPWAHKVIKLLRIGWCQTVARSYWTNCWRIRIFLECLTGRWMVGKGPAGLAISPASSRKYLIPSL